MNKFFDNFYNFKGFGPAIKATMPSEETLAKFTGKLPDRLLEYWQEYGFSGWGDGCFWLVNPTDYEDILQTWLEGTPFADEDSYYVIARGATGLLYVWGETSGQSIDIQCVYGMIFPTDDSKNLREDGQALTVDLFFSCMSKDGPDMNDEDDKPLFEQALKKLGPLEANEMYGFVPALALGGAPRLENLQKVNAIEHLSFLADLGEKQIMADIVALSNALPRNKKD